MFSIKVADGQVVVTCVALTVRESAAGGEPAPVRL